MVIFVKLRNKCDVTLLGVAGHASTIGERRGCTVRLYATLGCRGHLSIAAVTSATAEYLRRELNCKEATRTKRSRFSFTYSGKQGLAQLLGS